MKIAKKYIIQSGKHVGKLNQKLLQTPGKFKYRDPHPTIKGLYLLAFSRTLMNPQRWAVISQFPKLTGIIKINQQALQVPGTFKPGDPHPTAKNMVYRCFDGSNEWNGEKQGYKKDQKKWFGKNCIGKGTLQGYAEYGAKQFWADVKSIIVDKKDAKSLTGYTQ